MIPQGTNVTDGRTREREREREKGEDELAILISPDGGRTSDGRLSKNEKLCS